MANATDPMSNLVRMGIIYIGCNVTVKSFLGLEKKGWSPAPSAVPSEGVLPSGVSNISLGSKRFDLLSLLYVQDFFV